MSFLGERYQPQQKFEVPALKNGAPAIVDYQKINQIFARNLALCIDDFDRFSTSQKLELIYAAHMRNVRLAPGLITDMLERQLPVDPRFARPFQLVRKNIPGHRNESFYVIDNVVSHFVEIHDKVVRREDDLDVQFLHKIIKLICVGDKAIDLLQGYDVFIDEDMNGRQSTADIERNEIMLDMLPNSFLGISCFGHEKGHLVINALQPPHINTLSKFGSDKLDFFESRTELANTFRKEEKSPLRKELSNKSSYPEMWKLMLLPLSQAEAAAVYAEEVAASAFALEELKNILLTLEYKNEAQASILHAAEVYWSECLSTYVKSLNKYVGHSLLPLMYEHLPAKEKLELERYYHALTTANE